MMHVERDTRNWIRGTRGSRRGIRNLTGIGDKTRSHQQWDKRPPVLVTVEGLIILGQEDTSLGGNGITGQNE